MTDIISWIATVATIAAACMTASNLGARITGYGFAVFTVGSLSWLWVGLDSGQQAIVWTNVVLTGLNLFGVWRWLGRQAKVEDGGAAAAEKSVDAPGETLFPASILSSATVRGSDGEIGRAVEAMVGCSSGQIRYLVLGRGGVAGVGESFHRLDWHAAHVDDGAIEVPLSEDDLERLPALAPDSWPTR